MTTIPNAHTPDAPDYRLFSAEAEWEPPIRTPARVAELFLWLAGPVHRCQQERGRHRPCRS
jgi:hypothetical protein